jgi:hypothetical protein
MRKYNSCNVQPKCTFALTRVGTATPRPSDAMSRSSGGKKEAASDRALVLVANFSDEPLTILKSTGLGVAESVSETWVNLVNSDGQTTEKVPTEPRRKEGSKALNCK